MRKRQETEDDTTTTETAEMMEGRAMAVGVEMDAAAVASALGQACTMLDVAAEVAVAARPITTTKVDLCIIQGCTSSVNF